VNALIKISVSLQKKTTPYLHCSKMTSGNNNINVMLTLCDHEMRDGCHINTPKSRAMLTIGNLKSETK